MAAPAPPTPDQHPDDYSAGRTTAVRLINTEPKRVRHALELTVRQLGTWPPPKGKNGLSTNQYVRCQGFADTLASYLRQNGTTP